MIIKKTLKLLCFSLFIGFSYNAFSDEGATSEQSQEAEFSCDEDTKEVVENALQDKNEISKEVQEKVKEETKSDQSEIEKCLGLSPTGFLFSMPSLPGLGDITAMLCDMAAKEVGQVSQTIERNLQFNVTLESLLPDDIDPEVSEYLNNNNYNNIGVSGGVGSTHGQNGQRPEWFDTEVKKQKAPRTITDSFKNKFQKPLDEYTEERLEEYNE